MREFRKWQIVSPAWSRSHQENPLTTTCQKQFSKWPTRFQDSDVCLLYLPLVATGIGMKSSSQKAPPSVGLHMDGRRMSSDQPKPTWKFAATTIELKTMSFSALTGPTCWTSITIWHYLARLKMGNILTIRFEVRRDIIIISSCELWPIGKQPPVRIRNSLR